MKIGDIVFVRKTEKYWDKPYVMKRHHVYDVRAVILKVRITDIKDTEFKAILEGNNFDKDGQQFVFNVAEMLCNQDYKGELGVWH